MKYCNENLIEPGFKAVLSGYIIHVLTLSIHIIYYNYFHRNIHLTLNPTPENSSFLISYITSHHHF